MDLFTEGQKIALIFPKEPNLVEITCTVENIKDDRLELLLPQYFMRYIEFLQVGKKVMAKAFSKLGTVDFNTIIISSPLEENFCIELDYNSLKLTPNEDIPYIRAIENLEILLNDSIFTFKTFEISTEYIKFNSDKKFEIGQVIDCALILPKDYGIINFKAVINDIDDIYDNEYKANYMTMTEKARQALLYYMYLYSTNED